jgi:hypothetical protein
VARSSSLISSSDDDDGGLRNQIGRPDLHLSGLFDRLNLESVIDLLPDGYKAVYILHDVEGYYHKEIATIFGYSTGSSKSQQHKARKRLRELLTEAKHCRTRQNREITGDPVAPAPGEGLGLPIKPKCRAGYRRTSPVSQASSKLFLYGLLFSLFLAGCGGGSATMPSGPKFTSAPVTAATEGMPYSYQLVATSPDMSAVSFALTAGPSGASLNGNMVAWIPSHQESRIANKFTVTATMASGGSSRQTWTVTPNGTIQIKSVTTYWTPTGSVDISKVWPANLPYPAALVPQTDGSLSRFQGAANADGTFSIPNVPGGYYWLQLSPQSNYWTSSSSFDAGEDIVGSPLSVTNQNTTTINIFLAGLDPVQPQDLFWIQSNEQPFQLALSSGVATGAGALSFRVQMNSNIDFSQINTIFFNQYEPVSSGAFLGLAALGPAFTLSNVTLPTGGVINIVGTLQPSPQASIPLNIQGSAWANNYQNVAPSAVTPLLTDFSLSAQPWVSDRIAIPSGGFLSPNLALLVPLGQPTSPTSPFSITPYNCQQTSGLYITTSASPALPPILTDQNFGPISYGDPYPVSWPRMLQICQQATVQIPRPNSPITDTFLLTYGETIALPIAPLGPIAPLVGPVLTPTINGTSFFQPTTLNTTSVNLTWATPAGSPPFGYYVTLFQLTTQPSGTTSYLELGRFGTAKTSLSVPFLTAGNTYLFMITAWVDGAANMETRPARSQLPIAHSTVLSAPITIN